MTTPSQQSTGHTHPPAATGPGITRRAIATILAPILLAGCSLFNENSLDAIVFFDNTTDQTLYLRIKDPEPELKNWYIVIEPDRVNALPVTQRDRCKTDLVITDEEGNLVKDPGRICWHDTVTIP